jgi:NAD(P)-dependent dehydrogenase (short-subunit alcohol dehydrogenase family)
MNDSKGFLLITGAGSGLGASCVEHFSKLGRQVLAVDLKFDAPSDSNTLPVTADVCDAVAITGAIAAGAAKLGELRAVIHCAGILGAAKMLGRSGPHDLALFERVIHVNLVGTFNVCRLAALAMSKNEPNAAGERGVIVVTSSVAAEDGQTGQCAYAASKGGVSSMMLPMARDLASLGIRAVAIAPGVFETPMMQAAPENVRNSLLSITQFPKRFGEGFEFAKMAESVIANSMLNGAVIRLDGAIRMPAS